MKITGRGPIIPEGNRVIELRSQSLKSSATTYRLKRTRKLISSH